MTDYEQMHGGTAGADSSGARRARRHFGGPGSRVRGETAPTDEWRGHERPKAARASKRVDSVTPGWVVPERGGEPPTIVLLMRMNWRPGRVRMSA